MSATMEFEGKPDAGEAQKRMAAWWNREILDRPTIQVTAPRADRRPMPARHHPDIRARWMDVDYVLECAETAIANTYFAGESLPTFQPNLGPEIMTASLGAELEFGDYTSWSLPTLHDWADIPTLRVDPDNCYVRTILEMTRQGLERGRGKFLVGITDLHPGADLAASLRDPQQLCIDVADSPEQVLRLMEQLKPTFYEFYELQHALMRAAGQTLTTSWLVLFSEGRYYIPSNDFSAMISPAMNRRLFMPEVIEEIEWLDRSIYHLDGPQALRHLPDLLKIEGLDAIQYVCGAALEPPHQYMDVFQTIQQGGKNIHVTILPQHVDHFMEGLRPEGVMMHTWASSPDEADALVRKVASWKTGIFAAGGAGL